MKKLLLSALLILLPCTSFASYGVQTKTSGCIANQAVPNPSCTPGAVLTTNASIVCVSGYSSKVRDVSVATKEKDFAEYGIPYSEHANYEVDHLISLELGGSNDISNLWPEAHNIPDGSFIKDKLENYLHVQVCNGKITLVQAQYEISSDWLKYYNAWKGVASMTKTTSTTPAAVNTEVIPVIPQIVPASVPIVPTQSNTNTANISEPAVKESTSSICHPQGDPYYDRTIHFTPFNSMTECLANGGRMSK
jgi:hypothetical protein